MAKLSAEDRKEMPKGEFAGPGRSFPVNDKTHARMAISGATRSEHAGNISEEEANKIKAKARAKLGDEDSSPNDADDRKSSRKAGERKKWGEYWFGKGK